MQDYNQIDQQIHELAQILAKANRTFVPIKADDSHTNLDFDYLGGRIFGRWITTEDQKFILALNLIDFQFEWINEQHSIVQSYSITGNTIQQLEINIQNGLADFGLDPYGFRNAMHYEIPNYTSANEPFQKPSSSSLKLWMEYRNLANRASYQLMGFTQTQTELRIWPHHFDTGIYIIPNSSLGLGFGLAMEDALIGNPYFYFSGYDLNEPKIDYTSIPKLDVGKWVINENWKGAVLPLSEIKESDMESVQIFIKQISRWFLKS